MSFIALLPIITDHAAWVALELAFLFPSLTFGLQQLIPAIAGENDAKKIDVCIQIASEV